MPIKFYSEISNRIKNADVILVSDYAKGVIDSALMQMLITSGKKIIVDPRPNHTDYYTNTFLITPNRKEAGEMLNLLPDHTLSPAEMAKKLHEKTNANILITLGEDGMLLYTVDSITNIPTLARAVYDVTGAGDTVAAVIALGVGIGLSLQESAQLANVAAGVVVGKVGAATCSADELIEAIST